VETMIPFVAVYIDDVSLSERRILVDWQPDY
jgi:ribosomal 30S subunit maturation factor RimM